MKQIDCRCWCFSEATPTTSGDNLRFILLNSIIMKQIVVRMFFEKGK